MPRSKRDKKVSLTKTTKKGSLGQKQQFIAAIRQSIEEYESIFVFSVKDMRNSKLKDLRDEWKSSRFYFGKNTIMKLALGKTAETEAGTNLNKLSRKLSGQCGLLFTNEPADKVTSWFSTYSESDFARTGAKATETVELSAGPLPQFPFSMETHLRQLGLPTELKKGVVNLLEDYTVCKKKDTLKPEQAKILKLLGVQMSDFKLILKCVWFKDGTFKRLESTSKKTKEPIQEEDAEEEDEEDDVEMKEGNESDDGD